ncbi:hypothetical protein BpHYR1_014644 [Brachionus plicatilis]|uniref:Uncharacterized protein n=1 Tax=Brachionus plicatilis TaxID=10195 RepID=A0A3M7R3R7_BRAPC|nr:hypothetical protein BpHYR1_014644 [Brachionus plicatilis]
MVKPRLLKLTHSQWRKPLIIGSGVPKSLSGTITNSGSFFPLYLYRHTAGESIKIFGCRTGTNCLTESTHLWNCKNHRGVLDLLSLFRCRYRSQLPQIRAMLLNLLR